MQYVEQQVRHTLMEQQHMEQIHSVVYEMQLQQPPLFLWHEIVQIGLVILLIDEQILNVPQHNHLQLVHQELSHLITLVRIKPSRFLLDVLRLP